MEHDKCIRCGKELVTWERTRSECWNCRELTVITYDDTEKINEDKVKDL
ncbi:MAG: hypothetical protein H0Z33_05915 [Bacillaceae bacterium]|nr:hypothetical protein [Bacillaceae bacterium]